MSAERSLLLFSYGNLQQKDLQVSIFGRELAGRRDQLSEYHRTITDVNGVDYYNIEPSSDPEDAVSGMLFEVTEKELAAADSYEKGREYRRISVTLRSGVRAWAYYWVKSTK